MKRFIKWFVFLIVLCFALSAFAACDEETAQPEDILSEETTDF